MPIQDSNLVYRKLNGSPLWDLSPVCKVHLIISSVIKAFIIDVRETKV